MRKGRHFQAIDRLERDVERRVHADRDVRPAEIVVDGRSHADHRPAALREVVRSALGAVAADHHQALDPAFA